MPTKKVGLFCRPHCTWINLIAYVVQRLLSERISDQPEQCQHTDDTWLYRADPKLFEIKGKALVDFHGLWIRSYILRPLNPADSVHALREGLEDSVSWTHRSGLALGPRKGEDVLLGQVVGLTRLFPPCASVCRGKGARAVQNRGAVFAHALFLERHVT